MPGPGFDQLRICVPQWSSKVLRVAAKTWSSQKTTAAAKNKNHILRNAICYSNSPNFQQLWPSVTGGLICFISNSIVKKINLIMNFHNNYWPVHYTSTEKWQKILSFKLGREVLKPLLFLFKSFFSFSEWNVKYLKCLRGKSISKLRWRGMGTSEHPKCKLWGLRPSVQSSINVRCHFSLFLVVNAGRTGRIRVSD